MTEEGVLDYQEHPASGLRFVLIPSPEDHGVATLQLPLRYSAILSVTRASCTVTMFALVCSQSVQINWIFVRPFFCLESKVPCDSGVPAVVFMALTPDGSAENMRVGIYTIATASTAILVAPATGDRPGARRGVDGV